jgi:hypothetical protein
VREFAQKPYSKQAIDDGLISGRGVMISGFDPRLGMVRSRRVKSKYFYIDPHSDDVYDGSFMIEVIPNKLLADIATEFGPEIARRLRDRSTDGDGLLSILKLDDVAIKESKNEQNRRKLDNRRSYMRVWSKAGIGFRLKRSDRYDFGGDGDTYMVITLEPVSGTIMSVAPWPIPYWKDEQWFSWPYSVYDPGDNRGVPWPISPVSPGLGPQRFLDWAYSFLLGKVKSTSRDIAVTSSAINTDLKAALRGSEDVTVVGVDDFDPTVGTRVIDWIEFPQLSASLLETMRLMSKEFEHVTGMSELLRGQTESQFRSATEAELKGQFGSLRPTEMADKAEDWQSEIARKEAIAMRFAMEAKDMLPIVGTRYAAIWGVYAKGDLESVMREYGYTVAAGSMRKVSPAFRTQRAESILSKLGPTYMAIGDLISMNVAIKEWLESMGVENPEAYQLGEVPQPVAAPGQQAGGQQRAAQPQRGQATGQGQPGGVAQLLGG